MKILVLFFLCQPLFSANTVIVERAKAIEKMNANKGKFKMPSKDELKDKLTKIQFDVTQRDKTEPPFKNEFWDNKEEGIYVDIVSGEALFSSTHKYKSGTGWPSFYKPIEEGALVDKKDQKLFMRPRIEVRSRDANSHLGHVFDDGPEPTGKRFCINSAALKFIPKDKMKKLGYEKYLKLFSENIEEKK